MKLASSNQSLILAADYRGPGAKSDSVFDAALGPVNDRAPTERLTIVAPARTPAPAPPTISRASDVAPAQSHGDAVPTRRAATSGYSSLASVRPTELYAQTQDIWRNLAARSAYVDVYA